MSIVAAIRPDEMNFPLFLHVGGAMVMVGALLTASALLFFARGDTRSLRAGYFTLLAVGLPGYLVMRIGAQWLYTKGYDDLPEDPAWLGIGWIVADLGALLMLITLIVGGVGVHRLKSGNGATLLKVTLALSLLILAAALVAVWAMTGKPD